jgi:two-component system CheB/CheR fusion protein
MTNSRRSKGGEPKPPELPSDPDARVGNDPFPVVGVGASAGGLEAITQLLGALPNDTGMAFLVVQHLDPRHASRLPELLARATGMPVLEAAHGLRMEPDHVYVIPPNVSMGLTEGLLHLTPRGDGRTPHLPVDYLLRSIAVDQAARGIAVVLSGTGSDGTQGVCEIEAVGGITFAQDPDTAGHAGMPRSAIDSGCVDFVLPPEAIARQLAEMRHHPYLKATVHATTEPALQSHFQKVLHTVRARTGVDFTAYRDTTIRRRIMRRMALHSVASPADYVERLREDQNEIDALYHDLLINVTSFFRDPEMFEALKASVLPDLVKRKPPNEPFRIWVPGCSTGQEAYSLAMTVMEYYDTQPSRPAIQVFATDLSEQTALDKARAGVYPEGIELEITPERLRRFFRREDHIYRIDRTIRDMCVFARHNVTSDPPFSHLDLISCRNVLIYLSTPLQKRILPTFHYSLNVPGYLILGSAETVGDHLDLFDIVDRTHRIYAKKGGAVQRQLFFPSVAHAGPAFVTRRPASAGPVAHDFQREADRILLGRYAPPGVLVDENFDILQFRGRTSAFLEAPPGDPTNNVLKMAREGLFLELRNALTEAAKQRQTVRRDNVRVQSGGKVLHVAIEVVPVTLTGGAACYLVLFQTPDEADGIAAEPARTVEADPGTDREAVQLRQELAATREYLQSMLEQQDAANEELRSANEEILSSNEELQSTNEELETAKEELQSSNEELTTVNEQLHRRNHELDQANNDFLNLFSSSNLAVVMVGHDRRIRRFTSPARKLLNLLPTDIGRPIGDLTTTVPIPDLAEVIDDVVDRVQVVHRRVRDREGHWYMLRVHPYRTSDNRIDGVVLVLVDIDSVLRDQENLSRQAMLLELSRDAIIIRDAEDRIMTWNRGAEQTYGWAEKEALSQRIDELLGTDQGAWHLLNTQLNEQSAWEGELLQRRKDGRPILVQCREVLVRNDDGTRAAVLAIKRDVTEINRTMDALKQADRRKDEFLATLAHELRNPLSPIRNAIEIMRLAGDDQESIARAREVMDRQARVLTRMVEDLIDLARIVENKTELLRERIPVASVVENALETCGPRIKRNRQRLTVELPQERIYVDGDPLRLSQVIVNLLDNATKYTNEGGDISLSVNGSPDGSSVMITVRDTGRGIAEPLLDHIFEMFTQGPRSTQQGRGGLGVGLSLVKSLVEMHGGKVEVHSAGPNMGSEFIVHLPTVSGPDEVMDDQDDVTHSAVAPRRILVVDDNDDQVDSLAMLLSMLGHHVARASNGAEALVRAAEFKPDLMLVDIGMPGMEGYEVARRIREDKSLGSVTLVAQTGWGGEEDRRRSAEAGFDRHLVKPVALSTLDEVVRSLPA